MQRLVEIPGGECLVKHLFFELEIWNFELIFAFADRVRVGIDEHVQMRCVDGHTQATRALQSWSDHSMRQ